MNPLGAVGGPLFKRFLNNCAAALSSGGGNGSGGGCRLDGGRDAGAADDVAIFGEIAADEAQDDVEEGDACPCLCTLSGDAVEPPSNLSTLRMFDFTAAGTGDVGVLRLFTDRS